MTSLGDLAVQAAGRARRTRDRLGSLPPRTASTVLLVTVLAVVARLPFVARPLSADEGGFLMIAGQWSKGTSLYGDYWVDRPPLLITLFQLAHAVGGGAVGLRLVGIVWVAASVLLAAAAALAAWRSGRPSGSSRAAVVAASVTAAVFLTSPFFGATDVNGELLAAPFVLGGLALALDAHRSGDLRRWAGSGALAVAAAAVKQNMLDVFVAAAVLLLITSRRSPRAGRRAAGAFGAGAVVTVLGLLGWAAGHGTTPAGLWDAVVSFRFEAAAVIARSAPEVDSVRGLHVAVSFLTSGAVCLVLLALVPRRPGRVDRAEPAPHALLAVTGAVLLWEAVGVVGGGSYWLHYLVGTVPGLVLAAVCAARLGRRVGLRVVLAYAAAAAGVAVVSSAYAPPREPTAAADVERYLAARAHPGDTGMTAFGDPALLEEAGLPSPYPQLWSLPVRVRDPHLNDFTRVLRGPERPTWVVVRGSLDTWGIDPSRAEPVLRRDYRQVHSDASWHVFHVAGGR